MPVRNQNQEHLETTVENRSRFAQLQIGLAFFAFILIGANDGAFGVLIPSLRTHYGIDKATVGLLFLMQTIGYLIAAFNTGLLVEKLGNRRFLILGTLSFLLGALALSLMAPFGIVLVTMLLLGFGVAIIDAGLNAYSAGMPRNAALLNYLHAFYGTGALLGPLIASTILTIRWGWNSVYFVWIGMSLILLVGFRLIFEKDQSSQRSEEATQSEGNILVTTLRLPIVWIAAFFLLLYPVSACGLCLLGFSFGPIYPITISFLSNSVSHRLLPGAVGFLASLGSIGGAMFPWLTGILAQRVGLWSLMPLVILLTLAMICLWQLLQVRS